METYGNKIHLTVFWSAMFFHENKCLYFNYGWSTYLPLTYPARKYGLLKGLLTIAVP